MIKRIIYWVIMAALITTFLVIAFLCLDDYLNIRSDSSGWHSWVVTSYASAGDYALGLSFCRWVYDLCCW